MVLMARRSNVSACWDDHLGPRACLLMDVVDDLFYLSVNSKLEVTTAVNHRGSGGPLSSPDGGRAFSVSNIIHPQRSAT